MSKSWLFASILLLYLSGSSALLWGKDKVQVLVIDPGHGGKHPGAVGKFTKEKDITLAVSLKFGKLVEQSFSDVKVHYTRTDDSFVEVWKRPSMANKHKADLFISIHCNSSEIRGALPKGFETFALGVDYSNENLAVAQKENAAILYESDHESQYDGFDPNSPESYIIFSLYQNVHLDKSLNLGSLIQKSFVGAQYSVDRGLKQAGFLVLLKATMPSVLTEIGFINNPDEERYMSSEEGQNTIAQSLFQAFKEYKYQIEGFNNQNGLSASPSDGVVRPELADKARALPNESTSKTSTETPDDRLQTAIVFKVQFASSAADKPLDSPEFKNLDRVGKYRHAGAYKYTAGELSTLNEASDLLKKMQQMGYKDAFVVVFRGTERITTSEALKLLQP